MIENFLSTFFDKTVASLPVWAIILVVILVLAAWIIHSRVTKPDPSVSIRNCKASNISGRDINIGVKSDGKNSTDK